MWLGALDDSRGAIFRKVNLAGLNQRVVLGEAFRGPNESGSPGAHQKSEPTLVRNWKLTWPCEFIRSIDPRVGGPRHIDNCVIEQTQACRIRGHIHSPPRV